MADNLHERGSQVDNQPSNRAVTPQNNGNINIVLLGKNGVGKSSSGNTILGEDRFTCGRSLYAVTNISSIQRSVIDGRSVSVIDTPGVFCTNLPKEQLSRELARSVFLAAPGVHAFVFVVPFGRFTEQDEVRLTHIKRVFGEDALKNVIILFTYGDECDQETVQSEIDKNEVVRRAVQSCQGYHVLNNRDLTDRQQVSELLLKIEAMIQWNKGHYTNEMYQLAQMTTFERLWKIFKDFFNAMTDSFQNMSSSLDNTVAIGDKEWL